jgi:hypothetical protein
LSRSNVHLTCDFPHLSGWRGSDPRVTLGIYAHLVGDEQRVAADRVAGMLWSDVIGAGGSPGRIN